LHEKVNNVIEIQVINNNRQFITLYNLWSGQQPAEQLVAAGNSQHCKLCESLRRIGLLGS